MDEIVGGVVKRAYTYGLQRISENQNLSGAWTPSFYGYDGAGSVRYLTSATEAVTDTYGYDAFGNEVNHTGTTPNNYLYRGEQWDKDLGLYYLRARYMNPLTGRFLSRDPEDGDPAGPASLHKYLYADGEPVDLADPSGRATATRSASEYASLVLSISVAPVVINAVGATASALLCAYIWEGSTTDAQAQANLTNGYVVTAAPCLSRAVPGKPTVYPLPFPFPIVFPAPRGPFRSRNACDKSGEDPEKWHHIVPRAERTWAEGCGINIDQPGLGMCIKGSCHRRIHGGSNGTNWNDAWKDQIDNVWGRGSCPSDQDLVGFAQSIAVRFAEDILCQ